MEAQTPYGGVSADRIGRPALRDPPTGRPGAGVASVRGPETDPAIPRPEGIPCDGPDTL
jgi:hypothetical protein